MLTIALAVVLGLVALVLAFAATKPSHFRWERSAQMNAAPAGVLAEITDFHRWAAWSPWEKIDPAMTRTHSGAPSGVGAVYEWQGNKKVGRGRMEVLEATQGKVTIKLDFFEPYEAHNLCEFSAEPKDGGTHVTWAMHGPTPFMSKVMQVFMNLEKLVGKDFENGLANLKAVVERT
jgi:hypothetical protein